MWFFFTQLCLVLCDLFSCSGVGLCVGSASRKCLPNWNVKWKNYSRTTNWASLKKKKKPVVEPPTGMLLLFSFPAKYPMLLQAWTQPEGPHLRGPCLCVWYPLEFLRLLRNGESPAVLNVQYMTIHVGDGCFAKERAADKDSQLWRRGETEERPSFSVWF